MNRTLERVCLPSTVPKEKLLLGELHLLRRRLDEALAEIAELVETSEQVDEWQRVEEASRLARRALVAAAAAAPPIPLGPPQPGELRVGELRVDTISRRQWYGETEVELTPLLHRLLATMAAEPYRVFAKDELARAIWEDDSARLNAVKISVSKLRRALVGAGAPKGRFLLSMYGVGWALTRPN